jgi:fructokinase
MNIISIGEILWDVFEKAEHIGGAPFNFAAHAARLGHNVAFISAVGQDKRGQRALQRVSELGLTTRHIRQVDDVPTGTVTVFVDSAGKPDFTIHRPAAYDMAHLTDEEIDGLAASSPDWICFGTLHQMSEAARELTCRLVEAIPGARRLYDINLRKGSYTPWLVKELLRKASILKINDDEARAVEDMFGQPRRSLEEFCRRISGQYGLEGVCVTRGAQGCALFLDGEYLEALGYSVKVADTVGSGDAFAAAFVHGLGSGWRAGRIADFANRVGALIASRPGAVPDWTLAEANALGA